MIAIYTANQSLLESQVHQRKCEDNMKGDSKNSRHLMLHIVHLIYAFIVYLLRILLRCRNLFSK
jgi:hypothetical protein